jgi:hypothetical protein
VRQLPFVTQLFFVTLVCFVTELFLARQLFFVAKVFFVTGTIVPIPFPCAGLPLEAGLIVLLGGTEGGSERRCRMGFGVVRNYWWQGQNAFSEKVIGELLRFVD